MSEASGRKEMEFDAALAAQMIASPEAKALGEGSRGDADAFEKAALDFVKKAKALGVAPFFWGAKMSRGYYGSGGGYYGAMHFLLSRKHSGKAVAALAAAGASPWMISAEVGGPRLGVSQMLKAKDLARLAMGDNWTLTSRKIGLKSALTGIPSEEAPKLMPELLAAYEAAAGRASKTSKGVLGKADKHAKDCSGVIIHCKDELIRAGESIAGLGAEGQEAPSIAARLIALATECLAVKADKQNAAVNPEKVKKQATPQQRVRVAALIALCRDFSSDEELARIAFEGTAWLSEHPMLASVALGRDGSLFAAALSGGGSGPLAALEKAGANIWLAAAQAGEGNACAWACQMMARAGERADLARVARLLMIGSWLDGAEDPKARCLELALEAHDKLNHPYYQAPRELSQKLSAELERLTLNELIGDSASAEQTPRRRSSSL